MTIIKISLSTSKHWKTKDFIKPEYVGKAIDLDFEDRTSLVRNLMNIFLIREYTSREIQFITTFLHRMKLTRAETNAVILHLGFHYKSTYNYSAFKNITIDGYVDRRPKSLR